MVEVVKARLNGSCRIHISAIAVAASACRSEAQILYKQQMLQAVCPHRQADYPEFWQPLTGPYWGYRHKARIGAKVRRRAGCWWASGKTTLPADIEACPVMHPSVGTKLMDLSAMFGKLTIRDKIPRSRSPSAMSNACWPFACWSRPPSRTGEIMRDFAREQDITLYPSQGTDSIVPLSCPSLPAHLCAAGPGCRVPLPAGHVHRVIPTSTARWSTGF